MTGALPLLLSGLALGAVYALVALGFVVIYRASQVFNFAQGELLALGALLMVSLSRAGLPWGVALLGALALTGLAAAAIERVLLRPLVGRPVFVTIIVTLFAGTVLRALLVVAWGTDPYLVPTPWEPTATVPVLGAPVLVNSLAAVGAGAAALGAFFWMIRGTRMGVATRATASDQEVALALGIPVGRVFGFTWLLAGVLAALGGVCLGTFPRSADAHLGFVAIRAFPAAIVGGLESPGGTVVAALGLGVLEVATQAWINPRLGTFGHDFHAVMPYLVMILVLVVRPYGLGGRAEVERL